MTQIKELNLDNVVSNPKILIIGKRQCGKSLLCNTLMNHFDNSNKKIVVYGINYFDFENYTNPECQLIILEHNTFEKILLEHLLKRNESPTYNTVLCLDDCIHNNRLFEDHALVEMLYNGRHLGITIIITSQSASFVSSKFVSEFDYIFAFHDDNSCEKEKLYIRYFNKLKPFALFNSVFDDVTKNDYTALVVDRKTLLTEIVDNFFYFKAV